MKKWTTPLLLLAVALMMTGLAAAQATTTTPQAPATTGPASGSDAGPGVHDPGHPRVNEVNDREKYQQDRIARGVKSGKLTPGETANLEKGEQRIENQEKRDMAKHNGHLTKHEQRQLNGLEEKQSKKIYRDKHNNVGKK